MNERQKYRKKSGAFVIAVRLDIDTQGFRYQKWGGEQVCRAGDWIVNNDGETYTVSHETFLRTYEEVNAGTYQKVSVVWAEVAERHGRVITQEGETFYRAGDYIVFNNEDGTDAYAVSKERFETMYEPVSRPASL